MGKKLTLEQTAVRIVEIRQRLTDLGKEKTDLEDEKAEYEEIFKAQVKKQGITGVPTATHFVGVTSSKAVVITDEAKLLKAIKSRKWESLVIEPKLNKKELDKLVKAEEAEKKSVPGTKVESREYVKVQDRTEGDE